MSRNTVRMAAMFVLAAFSTATLGAVDSKKAAYYGGTASNLVAKEGDDPAEGRLDTANSEALVLTVEKPKPVNGQVLRIPYSQITALEYGQNAGRRVGTAVAATILTGGIGLVSLFSKKRNHFLTVTYNDDAGQPQVAVLEIGKDIIRTTLSIVQAKSGTEVEFQDEEARKAGTGK